MVTSGQELIIKQALSGLRRLTWEDIDEAFYNGTLIAGFYIMAFTSGISEGEADINLRKIELIHPETGVEIKFDRYGNCQINGQTVQL